MDKRNVPKMETGIKTEEEEDNSLSKLMKNEIWMKGDKFLVKWEGLPNCCDLSAVSIVDCPDNLTFDSHQQTRPGEKPMKLYCCTKCSYSTRVKSTLLQHQRTCFNKNSINAQALGATIRRVQSQPWLNTIVRILMKKKPYRCTLNVLTVQE